MGHGAGSGAGRQRAQRGAVGAQAGSGACHQRRAPQPALPERRGAFRAHRGHAVARGRASAREGGRHRHAVQPAAWRGPCARRRRGPAPSHRRLLEGRRGRQRPSAHRRHGKRNGRPRAFRGAFGAEPRRRGHPRGAGCHGGGQPLGGHGRVLPGAVRHRGVPHLHERRRVRRGAVRGVQERHRHRRGRCPTAWGTATTRRRSC